MKKIIPCLLLITFATLLSPAAFAAQREERGQVPEQVTIQHWSCKTIAELAAKYDAEKKLPESVAVEGKAISRKELASYLLSIMQKVAAKCEKEGPESISKEDLERIAALEVALKAELEHYEGYSEVRATIGKMLEKPELPPFDYKFGVNGFIRGEGAGNIGLKGLSYAPGHSEGRLTYRIKPYAYWHPDDYLDIHVEGQGYGFLGETSRGKFSLYQGFMEGRLPKEGLLSLKVGRQEIIYGSAFMIGANAFFDGLVFDAARLRVRPAEPLTIDILGGWYAHPYNLGLKGDFAGMYASYAFSDKNAAEAYFFRDTGSAERHSGEHLDIWGMRGTAALGPVFIELEPVYESGRLFNPASNKNGRISAYGGHVDVRGEGTVMGYHNNVLLSYAYGSGSDNPAHEFRNTDNDFNIMGDIHAVADLSGINVAGHHASGIQDFTLGWGIDFTKALNFSVTGHYFLANSVESGFSRAIGLETDFTFTYTINNNLALVLGYDPIFTGAFFKNASGSGGAINYGYAMLQFDLAKTRLRTPR